MPDTYFEFAIGYISLWALFFVAAGLGLKKILKQEKLLKDLQK